jgi:hypothetical protein
LVGASRQLNKGLKFTGNLLSKGFESLGGLISKKLLKNTTANVLTFTSEQVGNLFRFGKKVANDVGERF